MTPDVLQQIIKQIHDSAHKLVFEFTGAGSLALFQMHSVAGSSRTILEATDRYASTALVDLLVIDRDNPRSVSWVAHTLRGRLDKLAGNEAHQMSPLSLKVPNPNAWGLAQLCEYAPDLVTPATTTAAGAAPQYELLRSVLQQCSNAAYEVSEDISTTYFTHSGDTNQSLAT